jgi:Uma2 family endonuclease
MQRKQPMQMPHLVTAEDLEALPRERRRRCELVEGRLVRMSPVRYEHGRLVVQLLVRLARHVEERGLGVVLTEVGFKLAADPDTVRAPDVAFVRRERVPPSTPRGFLAEPPDLVVEVLSPEERPRDVRAKVDEYLTRAVTVVVVIDPSRRTATVCRRLLPPITLRQEDDVVELDDVIPDFRCTLREIFE